MPVAPGLSHSLHPDFYRHEILGSKERLGGNTALNAYLVEHPEHHLAIKLGLVDKNGVRTGDADRAAPPSQARMVEARGSFYEEMTVLFQAMEGRVDEDGAEWATYGISSAGLSLPEHDPMHVSWEKLLECAKQAASRAGRDK